MTALPAPLRAASPPLVTSYDVSLLDLDGVVYLDEQPVPQAAEALAAAREAGHRLVFVTNNASRTPAAVAELLCRVGVPATADDVVSSAHAAAQLLRAAVPPGKPVLVVGGAGLREAVADAGYPFATRAEDAAAVVQGYDAGTGYADLMEAALAVRAGAVWIAANLDATMPTPRGQVPGNGALVAAVVTASGRHPEVAGKPFPALHAEAVRRANAARPLAVGDRLDTDIAGAVASDCPSLLVLTGVTNATDLLLALPPERPTYVAENLDGLLEAHPAVELDEATTRCGDARVVTARDSLLVREGSAIDRLRALAVATWSRRQAGSIEIDIGGDAPYGVPDRLVLR